MDGGSDLFEVMVLGTYHMDNPGQDEVNVTADDVLDDERQAELRELIDRLADWRPDLVAVERPYDREEEIVDRYTEYRSGKRAYGTDESFPDPAPGREPAMAGRSEVVQIAFRLADHLDHGRVAAIDEKPTDTEDPFAEREIDPSRKTGASPPDTEGFQQEVNERLASSTIPEFLAWLNQNRVNGRNHALMFDRGIRAADEDLGSPAALSHWYDRNFRMVHHCWRAMEEDDDRLLVVIGAGHVRVLEQLFGEAPMFEVTSPHPYLPDPPA